MEAFTYKGITDGKYVEGDIEAINLDEASHLLKEKKIIITNIVKSKNCLLYTSPSPRDNTGSRMPSSA